MDLGTLDAQGYFELLQRLEGTGYSKDEESVRVGELRAWAEIAARTTEALDDVASNLFLTSADSALDLHERTLYLLQGASLPLETRRARLLAYRQSAPLLESRMSGAFDTYLGASSGSTLRPASAEALLHRAGPSTGFVVGRREPAATLKQQQRDLAIALERGLPARALSAGVSQRDAVWGDALEPAGIALTPAVTIGTQTKARVAPFEFRPGEQISREQWLELQAMLCWKSRGFSIDQSTQGRTLMVRYSLGPSTTVAVDGPTVNGSINWQNRFLQGWGIVAATTITDPTQLTDHERVWLPASKTGPSSGGYYQTFQTLEHPTGLVTAISLQVNATGDLEISNTGVSGTKDVALLIRCTPPYVPSSSADTQPWIDPVQLDHADMVDLYQAQVIADEQPGLFHTASAGALRRVVYSGALYYQPGNGLPQGVILDSSEDWRNRWLLVVPLGNRNGRGITPATNFPVPSTQGMIAQPNPIIPATHAPSAPRLFYTGNGVAMGSGAQEPYQHPLRSEYSALTGASIWMFADLDGNLCCEMKDPSSAFYTSSIIALVTATEKDTGDSVVKTVPVHATQVQTIDLEQPQNCGCYAQGQQGGVPRQLITDAAPRAVPTCPPLGVISEGHSPVRPVSWLVRERLGGADDSTYEVRQKITGQRRRIVSMVVPASSTVPLDDFNLPAQLAPGVNDQMDFRDRIVWVEGRWSASDITVSSTPANDNAGTPFLALLYSGPGTVAVSAPSLGLYSSLITTSVYLQFEFTRGNPDQGFHSRLLIQNFSGADIYVNCAIETSGFLGLTDRRAPGQAVA